MSNPRTRGFVYLIGFLVFAAFFCGYLPFVVMPNNGIAVALPVIAVPGEVVVEGGFFGMDLTNSIIGTILADILVIMIVVILWRVSKGWTKEVPGRMQGLFESFIGAFRNFSLNIGGEKLAKTQSLWYLIATIFFFLLVGNYLKLFPGVETVGKMHCAHVGQQGFPMIPGATDTSYRLWNGEALNAGYARQTEATEHACHVYFVEHEVPKAGFPVEDPATIARRAEVFDALLVQLPTDEEIRTQAIETLTAAGILPSGEEGLESEEPVAEATEIAVAESPDDETELVIAGQEVSEGDDHGTGVEEYDEEYTERLNEQIAELEEARAAEYEALVEANLAEAEANPESVAAGRVEIIEGTEYEDAASYVHYAEHRLEYAEVYEGVEAREHAIVAEMEELDGDDTQVTALEDELDTLEAGKAEAITQLRYPEAPIILSVEELDKGVVPYIFHITPFVRGPATDLSFTIALALLAIVVVQVYGVRSQGPAYFEKFINLSAIGNIRQRPLGAIDVIVGLIEIISEIGKIVSLAFRLFGNLFAGGIVLMAMSFLVAFLIPGVFYGLELIIGAVQALVFAVLTLVFSVQAMEGHHAEDHEHHEEGLLEVPHNAMDAE